jgi:hypothetical protein
VLEISALSLAYVRVQVRNKQSGAYTDPTGGTVQMAFPAVGVDPVSGDWKTASWETDPTPTPPAYYARCLVGPAGTVALAAGTYDTWVKVTATPEIPILPAGPMKVR